ncbi:MAG: glycosyltransferase family 1 protein [Methylobacteriaceae bacterium]|nr:glycosyltransferase family 1 protein [Methylobacteriaceae bacterium]
MSPHISIFTLGSRGDTQPFCVLGGALQNAGYDVTLCAPEPYRPFVESFGLKLRPVGTHLAGLKDSEAMNALVRGGINRFLGLPAFFREAQAGLVDFLTECWDAVEESDLAVFIPTTFFVADLARMRGIPSVRVALQPVFPTAKQATALFGSTDRGALANKLSYEIPRIAAPILWTGSHGFKAATGRKLHLGALPNPMTFRASDSLNLMAYSSALSPDPGDWPFEAKITGAWFYDAEPHLALAADIEDFLAKGPAIYIGFGSMKWHSEQSANAVFDAIAEWGGRALITSGWGGLMPPQNVPANIMFTGPVHHSLLFPRVSAVVHHGGAGTTAEGLRHGRPTLILPQFMDQYDWARRIEELGAGPPFLPMKKVTAVELAERLNALVETERYRVGAAAIAGKIAHEPGVAGAVAEIEKVLPPQR